MISGLPINLLSLGIDGHLTVTNAAAATAASYLCLSSMLD